MQYVQEAAAIKGPHSAAQQDSRPQGAEGGIGLHRTDRIEEYCTAVQTGWYCKVQAFGVEISCAAWAVMFCGFVIAAWHHSGGHFRLSYF